MTLNRLNIIRTVLEECNQQQVRYCVLRNYDFLLEERSTLFPAEKSVDIVVAKADLPAWEKIMEQFQFQPRDPHYTLSHHPYFRIESRYKIEKGAQIKKGDHIENRYPPEKKAGSVEVISFDLQVGGIHWNDLLYLPEKELLARRVKASFFYVPSDEDMFVMLLVHSLLGKRKFKPEYQQRLQQLYSKIDLPLVQQQLTIIFNHRIACWLLLQVSRGNFTSIIRRKYWLILSFLGKSSQRLSTFLRAYVRFLWWQDHLDPYLLISVIGPDGAGKSTAADSLYSCLREYRRKVALVYFGRGRGNVLPITRLGRRYKHHEKQRDRRWDQRHHPSRWGRTMLYTLAASIFTLDQLLRYWFSVMPKRRSKTIVVTDRYCSDLLLMKHVPLALKKALLTLFPKPTLTFYLYQDPAILHQRRPQEPVEELQRQLSLFAELKRDLHLVKIKTRDIEKDGELVITTVLTYLYQKWY
ncbi:MAG: hypothetical protein AABX13_03830 [Nanoarchaeota archaeon]